ncbi:MAG: MBL fold metallo-hydrolase [Burkholderiaceae bacterium]|nr:MBL fold metallo-hydrolase [Burkholderiaceae bacterium]
MSGRPAHPAHPAQAPHAHFGPVRVHFGEKTGKYPDGNQVIVRGADASVAFDTPLVANRIGAELDAVDFVVLGHVHEDHMAGLRRLGGVPVHVHEADLDAARSWEGLARHYGYTDAVLAKLRKKIEREFSYVPRPDAIGYRDGAVWELGGGVRVRALHMPGHTSGHCVLMVEPEGVAFIGDIDLSGFGPYYGDASSSLAQFRATLRALAELDARVWVTSHHKGAITDRAKFDTLLAAFAARIDERAERLLASLPAGGISLAELVRGRLMYPADHDDLWTDCAERRAITMHLDELLADARVVRDDDGRFRRA